MTSGMATLIVDDDVRFANALRDALVYRGLAAEAAYSVSGGLAAMDGRAFGVVVSDLQMGSTSGVTLLSEARLRRPKAILILMSGQHDALRLDGHHGFIDGTLAKPFALDDLCALVDRIRSERGPGISGVQPAARVAALRKRVG